MVGGKSTGVVSSVEELGVAAGLEFQAFMARGGKLRKELLE